jgi:hypothetical protein
MSSNEATPTAGRKTESSEGFARAYSSQGEQDAICSQDGLILSEDILDGPAHYGGGSRKGALLSIHTNSTRFAPYLLTKPT